MGSQLKEIKETKEEEYKRLAFDLMARYVQLKSDYKELKDSTNTFLELMIDAPIDWNVFKTEYCSEINKQWYKDMLEAKNKCIKIVK